MTRIFIHGLESSPEGTKGVFFRARYPDVILPTFTGDLKKRMTRLNEILAGASGIRMIGSSFGGLMGALYAMSNEAAVKRLVLLAPAIHVIDAAPQAVRPISVPVTVYHGSRDEVIPIDPVKAAAKRYFLELDFHTVADDHFLHRTFKTIDWETLLA
ncbi:MAG: YqiA/YcfP family alpha/beta fold hydrolase [Deltaproteobacteria bacterium]|nr:YqiA/YcfP family alpha/beta fold hydrolase [Deltaproteobacteria bacterium]